MLDLTKDTFKEEVEEYVGLVIIDLYADWCGPCRLIKPHLLELERQMPDVKFCKIDVDREPELTAMFKVESIPMIAAVKNDTFLDVSVGYLTKDALREFIERNK